MARFSLRDLYLAGDRLPDDPKERDAFLAEQRAELRGLRMVADWCHPCRRTRSQCECNAMNPKETARTAARASEIDKKPEQP